MYIPSSEGTMPESGEAVTLLETFLEVKDGEGRRSCKQPVSAEGN